MGDQGNSAAKALALEFPAADRRDLRQGLDWQSDGMVVISRTAGPNLVNKKWDRHRTGYVGLFAADNVSFDGEVLTFDVGERLANLRRQ